MRREIWLSADEAERERKYIAWCGRWALPVAGGLAFAALALFLWAVWTLSALLFT